MTPRTVLRSIVLALAFVLMTAAALAATRRDLVAHQEVVVDGQPLPAGSYSLKWKETTPGQFDVTVQRGTKVVVKTSGKEIQLDRPAINDAYVYATAEDGSSNLVEIHFAGSQKAIEVTTSAVARAPKK